MYGNMRNLIIFNVGLKRYIFCSANKGLYALAIYAVPIIFRWPLSNSQNYKRVQKDEINRGSAFDVPLALTNLSFPLNVSE